MCKIVPEFKTNMSKMEWQCGEIQSQDSIWNLLFQFRPSGIRIKRVNYSPALVAMTQIVYIGKLKRKLSVKEVSKLQSFSENFKFHTSNSVSYKQFGNSVNVKTVEYICNLLLK